MKAALSLVALASSALAVNLRPRGWDEGKGHGGGHDDGHGHGGGWGPVTTEVVATYTTVCPVTETITKDGKPTYTTYTTTSTVTKAVPTGMQEIRLGLDGDLASRNAEQGANIACSYLHHHRGACHQDCSHDLRVDRLRSHRHLPDSHPPRDRCDDHLEGPDRLRDQDQHVSSLSAVLNKRADN